MDLLTYWRVIKSQRRIVIVGLSIAFILTMLAMFRVSPSGIELRSPPVYTAKSTLFVTQSGFPWGRSALAEYVRARGTGNDSVAVPRFADPSRMEYLASLYSKLAESDSVRAAVTGGSALAEGESFTAVPLRAPDGRSLPLIEVSATSPKPERAVTLANRASSALQAFVSERQKRSGIPEETRILLPTVEQASSAEVLQGVKLTTPIMIALLGTIATLFVAFVMDNVRRQRLFAEAAEEEALEPEQLVRPVETPPTLARQSSPRR